MNHQIFTEALAMAQVPMITLSDDGYVRLTLETFLSISLVHLHSGLDENNPISFREGASFDPISGYTEWVSTKTPIITMGWDWRLAVSRGRPFYIRLGAPRSNVMLVDAQQHDLGPVKTTALLETVIDALAWQAETYNHIGTRYA